MTYIEELEKIRKNNRGILQPRKVVAFARNPKTDLHDCFEWNNSKAAEKYRLKQARELIQLVVQISPTDDKLIRVYVSLTDDRKKKGGGYRPLSIVMQVKKLRQVLLKDALADMKRFEIKYRRLAEMADVITAMKTFCGGLKKKGKAG